MASTKTLYEAPDVSPISVALLEVPGRRICWKKERRFITHASVSSVLIVCERVRLYLEAPFLHVCDWMTGHFVLCGVREGLPGDGCDRLRLLGQLGFVVGKTESETGQRTVAHLQGSNQRYNKSPYSITDEQPLTLSGAKHHLARTHLDQGHSVSIRAGYRDVDQRLPQCWSLAFFGSTIGGMQTVVWAEVLVLGVDVLALLAWLVLATSASQVDVVGVETGHED